MTVESKTVSVRGGMFEVPVFRSGSGAQLLYIHAAGGMNAGFPKEQAWWTVKRQAMCADASTPVGLYFGTTNGEIWASDDEGSSFHLLFRDLPHIFSVTCGDMA